MNWSWKKKRGRERSSKEEKREREKDEELNCCTQKHAHHKQKGHHPDSYSAALRLELSTLKKKVSFLTTRL